MRKKMLAAALLPLPFAAIPLFAVVFAGTTQPQENDLALETTPVFEMQADANAVQVLPEQPAHESLAYTGADQKTGCIDVEGGA